MSSIRPTRMITALALALVAASLLSIPTAHAAPELPATDLGGRLLTMQTTWNDGSGPAVVARVGNGTTVELQPANDEGWWQHHWQFEAVDANAGVYRIKNRSTRVDSASYLTRVQTAAGPTNGIYLAPQQAGNAQRWNVTVEDMGGWTRHRLTAALEPASATLSVPGYPDANGAWQRGSLVTVEPDYATNSQRFLLAAVGDAPAPGPQAPPWFGDISKAGLSEPTLSNAVHVNCDSGNDQSAGTTSAPWRTLGRIGRQATGTDVVIAGTCVGQRLLVNWSGTTTNPVIIQGAGTGSDRPVLRAHRNQIGADAIVEVTGSRVELWDLILEGSSPGTTPCPTTGSAKTDYLIGAFVKGNDNTIARIDASGFYAGVFIFDRAQRNLVTHSALHNNDIMTIGNGGDDDAGAMGILVSGDNTEISWNWFYENRACSPDYGQDGASIEIFNGGNTNAHDNHAWREHVFTELGEGLYNDRVTPGSTEDNTFDRNYFFSDVDSFTFVNPVTGETRLSFDAFVITRWTVGGTFGDIERTTARNNRIVLTGTDGFGFICVTCTREALSVGGNDITIVDESRAFDNAPYRSVAPLAGGTGPDSAPVEAFACASNAGALTWTDHGQSKYWVYKSTNGGATYNWIGRTLGATAFTDRNPTTGAKYQVHYQGIPRVDCSITAEPISVPVFSCTSDGGALTWTDHGQSKYWVYKSTNGGATYNWIGRTLGATTFTDRNPTPGARYQVHYQGIPRVNCSTR